MAASVFLRSLEPDDEDRVYSWHNDPELYSSLVGSFRHVSRLTVRKWLAEKTEFSSQEINLAICLSDGAEHIGNIYLRKIDWIARCAELGIFIALPEHRTKGYGTQAIRLMLKYAFEELGLNRVYLSVLETNLAAIKVYEKCGFKREGVLRNHVFKGGKFRNLILMGICCNEFELQPD